MQAPVGMRAANKLPLRRAHALLIRLVERNEKLREPAILHLIG
jgi:hypothetical protein